MDKLQWSDDTINGFCSFFLYSNVSFSTQVKNTMSLCKNVTTINLRNIQMLILTFQLWAIDYGSASVCVSASAEYIDVLTAPYILNTQYCTVQCSMYNTCTYIWREVSTRMDTSFRERIENNGDVAEKWEITVFVSSRLTFGWMIADCLVVASMEN